MRSWYAILPLFLLFPFLFACSGGGTAGSGVVDTDKSILFGTVADDLGQPLVGVTLTTLDGAASAETDDSGNFSLPVDTAQPTVDVSLSGTPVPTQVSLPIDSTGGQIRPVDIRVDAQGNATATPRPNATPTRTPSPVRTPNQYPCTGDGTQDDPVCGKDGKTYHNACDAFQHSVEVAYRGRCGKTRDCRVDPVCGKLVNCPSNSFVCAKDNKTYPNSSSAHARGLGVAYRRSCIAWSVLVGKDDCTLLCAGIPPESAKVCGKDGVTYRSECFALEAGAAVDYPGDCGASEDCAVDPICGVFDSCPPNGPVCGKDNRTHASAEEAHALNIGVAYHRACVEYSYPEQCKLRCIGPAPLDAVVCGVDGVTYHTLCEAWGMAGVQVAHAGACP